INGRQDVNRSAWPGPCVPRVCRANDLDGSEWDDLWLDVDCVDVDGKYVGRWLGGGWNVEADGGGLLVGCFWIAWSGVDGVWIGGGLDGRTGDAAHLKGQYKGTNLIAVGMDGNNQIVSIAFGICKGETSPCWSWWMSVLKECIGDNPDLLFISERHAVIALAVQNEFPLAYHADIQPDAYDKLCQVSPQRWSRAHCPLVRYNYLTSNSVESVNACTVVYRKLPVIKLAETYRAMVQDCF
ncbi:transposase, MuDR, MULE transposase domain protein, partial [Tanacetum coccineum]